jgi:hypothetical protein
LQDWRKMTDIRYQMTDNPANKKAGPKGASRQLQMSNDY